MREKLAIKNNIKIYLLFDRNFYVFMYVGKPLKIL